MVSGAGVGLREAVVWDIKKSILGCGYVGAVTGACFAELGNEVIFVDIDPVKVATIATGRSPIYKP